MEWFDKPIHKTRVLLKFNKILLAKFEDFIVVLVNIQVSVDVKYTESSNTYPEDGGSTLLRNVCNHLPLQMA
jgi:hypothetical protein